MGTPKRNSLKTKSTLLLICLFALLIRISFLIILQPWDEDITKNKVLIGDSIGYHTRALSIIDNGTPSTLDAWWTPGYLFFIAFIYSILGIKPWLILLAQVLLDTGIVLIAYFMAHELFKSEATSLIAAFLYAISFPSAFYSIRLLSETTFTFVLALSILVFIKSLKKSQPEGYALTGFITGIAAYIRAAALYFPAVFAFVLLFDKGHPMVRLRNIIILLLVFAVTLFPWQFRNLKQYGEYAMTTKGSVNLIVNASIVKAEVEHIDRQKALEALGESSSENPFEQSKIRYETALSYISEHPFAYIKCQIRGIIKMFLGTGQSGLTYLFGVKTEPSYAAEDMSESASKIANSMRTNLPNAALFVIQIIEYLFVVIGIVFMFKKDKRLYLLLLIMIILYFAAITGPIGYSRFRVPIIPFYLVISAAGMLEVFRRFTARKDF